MQSSASGWVRGYRGLCAGLIFIAIGVQFWQSVIVQQILWLNYFSYFTIQSNLFVAGLYVWLAIWPYAPGQTDFRMLLRGAVTLYLSITGIVYGVLLSGLQSQFQIMLPWTNMVLHMLIPWITGLDWFIDPPSPPISFRQVWVWFVYPTLWMVYTFIRGALIHWYPYPFLNPAQPGGYLAVIAYCVGITLMIILMAWIVVILGRKVRLVVN